MAIGFGSAFSGSGGYNLSDDMGDDTFQSRFGDFNYSPGDTTSTTLIVMAALAVMGIMMSRQ